MNEIYVCTVELTSGTQIFLVCTGKPKEEPEVYRIMGSPSTRRGEVNGVLGCYIFERSKVAYLYYYRKGG